jgi:dienelactone hydrolase
MASERAQERPVRIPAAPVVLDGDLAIPSPARGMVLFAHGSGSSRHSRRNRAVAATLHAGGFATLLMDLLTADEDVIDQRTRHLRFDIDLLAGRLVAAIDLLARELTTERLPIGLFGASTGAAAAISAAAERPSVVQAVVSRGGRPDLAGAALDRVKAPVLLLVGGEDEPVIALNQTALARLKAVKELVVIPGATHLFEEPGTLEQVADDATRWFERFLPASLPAT